MGSPSRLYRVLQKAKLLRTVSFVLCTVNLLFFPLTAAAFKVGTHVWVAQQVLNDLDDGKLTIPLGNGTNYEATVDPIIVDALKHYPAQYRMGNVGPDAFPDMLTGQLVVHPGINGGWKTDDWLRFLLQQAQTPEQKAFAYGYLGHAAADVFAHTYVNHYSGDIFLLADGELEVEKRHGKLENYIDHHTPALLDVNGNYLGQPYELVSTPQTFLRDTLILNDTVATQNGKGLSVHLALVNELRNTLDNTHPFLDQMDMLITQLVVSYYTGISLNDEQAAKLFDLANQLHQAINANNGIDQIQAAKNKLSNHIQDAIGFRADIENRLNSAMVDVVNAKSKVDQLALDLLNKQLELGNTLNQICHSVPVPQWPCPSCNSTKICGGFPRLCVNIPAPPSCFVTKYACEAHNRLTDNICDINPAYVTLQATIAVLERQKADAEALLLKTLEGMRAATDFARDSSIAIIQAETAAFNGLIDSAQFLTNDLNPVRAHIDGWIKDIDDGMSAYIIANAEVIKDSMMPNPDPDGDPLRSIKPLQEWKDCWGYAVTGVLLGPANNALCTVQDRLGKLQEAMNTFENRLISLNPVGEAWVNFKAQIEQKANAIATDLAYEIANKVTGEDVKEIIGIFISSPADPAALNALFSRDNSTKGLLLITDMAERIENEMYLTTQQAIGPMPAKQVFDPQRFAVAYDAVTLAKLALLGPEELNRLAIYAGVTQSTEFADGVPLYNSTATQANVLIDAISSIDGNHHWMKYAPPYPRRAGDAGWNETSRSYGYPADGHRGFRLFQDPQAREKLFLNIFKGPLVPSLEIPLVVNSTPLLPADYPYVVCEANPFPESVNDLSCIQLSSGVPLAGLSGAINTDQMYIFDVPAGVGQVSFQLSGGSGDADLYVRYGAVPTTDVYDCRPYIDGNAETCNLASTTAGRWYVLVRGYTAFANVSLVANFLPMRQLQNGVPINGLAGATATDLIYSFEVPPGASTLSFQISGGIGDADLYVHYGSIPTDSIYDCRPYIDGNDETCILPNATAGTWYVMLRGYTDFSGVSLLGGYQ
jgi:Bacterial pre-peptidase C-terminal domain/Zinc dependent phospholipase C